MELVCAVQYYHWGKRGTDNLVAKLSSSNIEIDVKSDNTFAEFWMGTHPNGPSYLKVNNSKLSDHLLTHPNELGEKVINTFGCQLPFLFKILSVEKPLSIQAHPSKSHAQKLFETFPALYKDDNHKPELAIALSKFEALCGFQPQSNIKYYLKNIPEFGIVIDQAKIDAFIQTPECDTEENRRHMKNCFESMMLCEKEVVASAIDSLISRLDSLPIFDKEKYFVPLVKRIHLEFPKDVGIFCVYWLNYLVLSPGQALYLAPNEPHAYLYGECLECMANSDNVVRAGLTPKFRDVPTLCEMLTYKNYHPSEILFNPIKEDEYCLLYSPPVEDFVVAKICLPKNVKYSLKRRESASILLVLEGVGKLNSQLLKFGKVFYIPYSLDCIIESDGLVLFQAFCNVQ